MTETVENILLIISGLLTAWCIWFLLSAPGAGIAEKFFGLIGYGFTYYLSVLSFKGAN